MPYGYEIASLPLAFTADVPKKIGVAACAGMDIAGDCLCGRRYWRGALVGKHSYYHQHNSAFGQYRRRDSFHYVPDDRPHTTAGANGGKDGVCLTFVFAQRNNAPNDARRSAQKRLYGGAI